jgi:integrase
MPPKSRNDNGQGTIVERELASGKIVYDAWVSVKDSVTGKPKRPGKRGHKSRTDAQRWINKTAADAEAGVRVLARRGGMTVQQCMDEWAEGSPLKPSTIAEYSKTFRTVVSREIGSVPIASLMQNDIDRMISSLHRSGKPVTQLAHAMMVLKHVWAYAKSAGQVNVNIIEQSPWGPRLFRDMRNQKAERDEIKQDQGLVPVLRPEQVKLLIETERVPALRAIWEFIASTGVRRGEALALRWKDVYLDEGYIWIRVGIADTDKKLIHLDTPKGNKRRKIFIAPATVQLLREHKEFLAEARSRKDDWEEHDLVFPLVETRSNNGNNPGHWMLPSNLSIAYNRRAKKLGFSSTKLHGLRFYWASTAYANGVDLKTIRDHLGHGIDVTTLVYVIPDDETKKDAVVRVVDHLHK